MEEQDEQYKAFLKTKQINDGLVEAYEEAFDRIRTCQDFYCDFFLNENQGSIEFDFRALGEILEKYKENWDNQRFAYGKMLIVDEVLNDADINIVCFSSYVRKNLAKLENYQKSLELRGEITVEFTYYQAALYLYSFSSFLQVLLIGDFSKEFLDEHFWQYYEYLAEYEEISEKISKAFEDAPSEDGVLAFNELINTIYKLSEKILNNDEEK